MTGWIACEGGSSIGATGSEGGTILRDELHPEGSRITLELNETRFAITCGVYGWMVHTRFFANESDAAAAYEEMKPALAAIVDELPATDAEVEDALPRVTATLRDFIRRFP
ncbi:MAG TPA: hypothetical protein VE010_02040 [Thermoanaerobaculia bacterium]|nr:hypothetical protein [Thermoanaerobaculia bacterium]